jgi:hypothetical protein
MRLDLLRRAFLELLPSLYGACDALLVAVLVGRLLQPRRRRPAMLGRSVVSMMPPPHRCSSWAVALLPQPWLCRRVTALVFYLAPLGALL